MKLKIPEEVYPPAEDSYMLADACYSAGKVLELGCGSGLVALCWAKKNNVTAVDINPAAVQCCRYNAIKNSLNIHCFESDLFSSVSGTFDAILFNPPYLPTSEEERLEGEINRAYDGGENGRQILDRFLDAFSSYLKPDGSLFLIQSSLNNYDSTIARLQNIGFKTETIDKQEFFFEKLYLIKACKS
ncbi:methyltransferase [Candidatus Micrarchaeota archaeon]|nr:methyltransferase [Candidatus Micrarchaeota archaeon]